jgi:hypothetical protein
MSQTVRAEALFTRVGLHWADLIRKNFRDATMIKQIEEKVVNLLRQVTAAII